jgi:hypothetical protein
LYRDFKPKYFDILEDYKIRWTKIYIKYKLKNEYKNRGIMVKYLLLHTS